MDRASPLEMQRHHLAHEPVIRVIHSAQDTGIPLRPGCSQPSPSLAGHLRWQGWASDTSSTGLQDGTVM